MNIRKLIALTFLITLTVSTAPGRNRLRLMVSDPPPPRIR